MLKLILILLICSYTFAFVNDSAMLQILPKAAAQVIVQEPVNKVDSVSLFVRQTNYDSVIVVDSIAQNPYAELEQIAPEQFQNMVVRYNRLHSISEDSTQKTNIRDFARASQYFYKCEWDSAYNAYANLINRDSLLKSAVVLRMALAKFNAKKFAEMRATLLIDTLLYADESFDKAASKLRIEAAMNDSTLSDKAHADSIKAFLDKYSKTDEAIALKFRYAKYLEQFKQMKNAKRIYMQLLTSSGAYKDSAFVAIRRLRKVRGTPETLSEKVAYAKMACAKDDALSCLTLLDSIYILDSIALIKEPELAAPVSEDSLQKLLPKSTLDMPTRITLWEKRAVALRSLKREVESIAQFKFLLDSVEARPLWMQSILRLYRNNAEKYFREIKYTDSLLQDISRFSKENANNLWVKGFEYEQKENYDSALVCYKSLSNKRFKNNIKRQWAKFRIGFVYFKQEKWEEAANAFVDATKDPFLWSGSAARMFLGDTYIKMKKDSLALEAYLDCIKDFPLAYYAHRSRLKLVEYGLMKKSDVPYARGVAMSFEQTLSWVRASQKIGKPDSSYSKGRYNRIKMLFMYGFSERAFALYDEARKKNAKRLDFLYEYGKLFYEMGETAAGYRLARQFQNTIDRRKLMAAPIDVLHFLYPVPYKEQVKFHSKNRIDPFFVYSVMRQESIFNFEIKSPAGACGLLQIMPATGKMLATKESIANFVPEQLFNAYMNIRLGIRYLVDLKAEYDNDYMYVLGNYNAGPKPTKRWQAAGNGLSWDVRAEEISYWETRDYVKRVMGNYWIYQEIYDKL